MGCRPSTNDPTINSHTPSSHYQPDSSNQNQGGRVNIRLLMNPADNNDNRNTKKVSQSVTACKKTPLLTLEQACQGLQIQDLPTCIANAKYYSQHPKGGLSQDEQAAINLYTQQTSFYKLLNEALRQSDGHTLTPWYRYLKLFLTALNKLPPHQGTVWRAVPHGISAYYRQNDEKVWWAFSSCTSSLNILQSSDFLGATGVRTLFSIEVFNGRRISDFSDYAAEDEILLLPGTHIRVVGELKESTGLHIIHLKQIEPSYFLMDPSESVYQPPKYAPQYDQHQTHDVNGYMSQEPYSYENTNYGIQSTSINNSLPAFNTQIQLATNISNDSQKADVLKHLLANKNLSDEMIAGVAECVETMHSSRDMGDVLRLIAKRSGLTTQQFRVSVTAASSISNDGEKGSTIKAFLIHEQFTVQHLDVVLSAAETMYSSTDKASVFTDLVCNRYLNGKHFPSILNGINDISNDGCKSNVLCKLAPRLPKNDANVLQAYLTAADSICSSQDKAAVTKAFTADHKSIGTSINNLLPAFDTQIQLATNISNDSQKADVLKHLLANKNLSDEMIAGVAECVETMHSSRDMGDVLRLIAKRSGLTTQQFRVSVTAASSISNDGEKGSTIKAFLIHEQFTVQHLEVVLSAAETMYSSTDKASVFTDLVCNRYLNGKHFPSILNGISDISSDGCKGNVLCKLAPRLPKNDANVLQAYLTAADSICSSQHKAAATKAFM